MSYILNNMIPICCDSICKKILIEVQHKFYR